MLIDFEEKIVEKARARNIVRSFDSFDFKSYRVPKKHAAKLKSVAKEIIKHRATTVIVIGHALGSTMERKYLLGFRRALGVSKSLREFIGPNAHELSQFPRFLISSIGDTFPRMGNTAQQDRRVDVLFRRKS